MAPRSPDSDPHDLPDAIVRIRCLSCEAVRYYTIHDRRVRQFPWSAGAEPSPVISPDRG
jgi:hypothetical protein